ncbi:MAG: hypothetical protein DBX55_05215 [Verrucomicrobia bacterium]|nr:MAG: hypothetical protein DBX55_05215 [Verrucomicrobiota bacterium]
MFALVSVLAFAFFAFLFARRARLWQCGCGRVYFACLFFSRAFLRVDCRVKIRGFGAHCTVKFDLEKVKRGSGKRLSKWLLQGAFGEVARRLQPPLKSEIMRGGTPHRFIRSLRPISLTLLNPGKIQTPRR